MLGLGPDGNFFLVQFEQVDGEERHKSMTLLRRTYAIMDRRVTYIHTFLFNSIVELYLVCSSPVIRETTQYD